jgi:tetratricopeptide (TPR) repeat protein
LEKLKNKAMRKYTTLLVWSCFYFLGNTQSLQDAEKAYKQENYSQAISIWNLHVKDETLNKSLIYNNIGTSYAKQKEWAKAILYFEKAVKQHYNNEKAQLNLKIVRAKLNLSNENNQLFFVNWWLSLLDLFSIFGWQMICFLFIILAMLLYVIKKKNGNFQFQRLFYIFLFFGTISIIIIFSKKSILKDRNEGIIIVSETYGYKDTNMNQKLGLLKMGEKVELLENLENQYYIKNESDSAFWISKKSVEVI